MQSRIALMGAGLLLLTLPTGCEWFNKQFTGQPTSNVSKDDQRPTANHLVSYLNSQSDAIKSLQVNNLAMEAKMGAGVLRSVALNGTLQAQKPRNFRLEGYLPAARTEMVDLGSNDREFWFWIGQNDPPYLYHCAHTDLPRAQLPLPIHPDWIMEALGMSHIEPGPHLRVNFPRDGNTIELVEPTRSPQGQPMYKVTVFNRRTVAGTEPQVLSRKLIEGNGDVICVAEIKQMQQDRFTKLVVPQRIDLTYPGKGRMSSITLSLVLDTIAVNADIDPAMARHWFNRPNRQGVMAVDLGRQGSNNSANRNALEPAGGIQRGSRR
jgi:hypothetical protein